LIRLSPTGDLLALRGFEDGYYAPPFHVRRVDGGEIVWGNQETYYPFLFSGDGTLVYAISEVTAGLISRDARTGELVQDIGGWYSHALAGSPDGRWLLGTGAPDTNSNGSLTQFTLWRTSDGTHTLPGDEAPGFYALAPMAMSSDGERWANLAAGDGERYEVHLWALVAGAPARLVLRLPTPYTSSPAFSPDGLEVVVGPLPAGPGRSKVNVYNASDGALLRTRTITASL
jgi:hypothetical protein